MKERFRLLCGFLARRFPSGKVEFPVSDLILLAILLLGLSLRLYHLTHYSMTGDELPTMIRARDLTFGKIAALIAPVTYWIQRCFYLTLPHNDFFFRLPAALSGVGGLLFIYLVARECFGKTEGLAAAFLLAVAPFHIHYSQDIKHYAHLILFTLGGTWCLVRGFGSGSRPYWLGFVAFGLLNILNQPIALFVTGLQCGVGAILAALHARELPKSNGRAYLRTAAPLAVSALVIFGTYGIVNCRLIPDYFGLVTGKARFEQLGFGVVPDTTSRSQVLVTLYNRFDATSIPWVTLALFFIGVAGCIPRFKRGLAVCLSFVLACVAIIVLARFRVFPAERYFLWALPFYLILLARGIRFLAERLTRMLARQTPRPGIEHLLTVCLLLVPYGLFAIPVLVEEYRTEKGTEWKMLARFLKERMRNQEPVVVDSPPEWAPYYYQGTSRGLEHYFTYGPPRLATMPRILYTSEPAELDELGKQWPEGWFVHRSPIFLGVEPRATSLSAVFPGVFVSRLRLRSPRPISILNGSFEIDSGVPRQSLDGSTTSIPDSYLPSDFTYDTTGGNDLPDGWIINAANRPKISLDRQNKCDGERSLRVQFTSDDCYFQAMSLPTCALPCYAFEASAKMKLSDQANAAVYVAFLDEKLETVGFQRLNVTSKEDDWTVLGLKNPVDPATCFVTPERTAAIAMMVQVERGTTSGTAVWFDDVQLKGAWDPARARANFLEQRRKLEFAEVQNRAETLLRELAETTQAAAMAGRWVQTTQVMEDCQRLGFPATVWRLADSAIRAFPVAAKSTDTLRIVAEGKSIYNICKQIGFDDGAERLAQTMIQALPERKDLESLSRSVRWVVVHEYDWLKDPIRTIGIDIASKTSDSLEAIVAKHAYIFPAGHGRPFPCDGSYAIRFEMKVASKGPSPPGSLAVYLNTRTGLGPNGYDWGEFDAFSVPLDTTGQTTTYTIALRSKVEKAKFIHEFRIDPLASTTSFTFEIGNMRLLRLESLAHEVPKPEGFIPFTVERPTTFIISTQRTLLSTSPLLLDYSPLKQLDSVMLTTGEHILTLPHGWSESDVAIRPKEGIHFGKDFLNIYGGIMERGVANLFVQDGKFDIATSLTAKTEYAISVEAENSHIRPVILALRSSDGNTEMAQYVFDRRDDSMSWQEKRIVPPQDMNRISVVFISDYVGPEGDLNARVRSVRITHRGSSDNAR